MINVEIYNLIEEYSNLKDNWDGDNSKAPSKFVISKTKHIVDIISKLNVQIYHLTVGVTGEVMINLRNTNKSIEIIVYDHLINIVFYEKKKVPNKELFDILKLNEYLYYLSK